jgi:hypothetical protein
LRRAAAWLKKEITMSIEFLIDLFMAERVGFEPTVELLDPTHDFQSCPFDHSGTSPRYVIITQKLIELKEITRRILELILPVVSHWKYARYPFNSKFTLQFTKGSMTRCLCDQIVKTKF